MAGGRGSALQGGPTTGVQALDGLIGGIALGDNLVWEADSGAPVGTFVGAFLSACEAEGSPVVYVSFNHSPQTIASAYGGRVSASRFTLVDCFSSGKGDNDETFLAFYRTDAMPCRAVRPENPADPDTLQAALGRVGADAGANARYVFDSLTGMLGLWGDEDAVLRFFSHVCPRLYDLNTIAYWLLELGAHSQAFLAKLRHVTQVVLEVAVASGIHSVTVRKSGNRPCPSIGVPHEFDIEGGRLVLGGGSREDRELGLLTRIGRAIGTALEPSSFFEQTMEVIAKDLGMVRGTLVLLDRTTDKLRIAAAYGLSLEERARGEYAIGEGVTGHVAQTGRAEVVPDISKDPRFLDRTAARKTDPSRPIAFICVPLKVDEEVVGALSADRPLAAQASLDKDLRLLTIIASTVSQVLKIHRMIGVDKEQLLARDERLLRGLRSRFRLDNIVGHSEAIQRVLATAAAAAAGSRAAVLITGETGTGKELVANVVHYNGARAASPFVKVNCGALAEELLESELFGHVQGAFTGAIRDHKGRFEAADHGTLFLDEVAEMSPRLQVKLLRVLQEGEFEPVGSEATRRADVRVVAATNRDLRQLIADGRFREDLYYRLDVIPIHLPPLRERREDIPLLVRHFLEAYNRRNGRSVTKLSREVLDLLLRYPWPGNVRELENCIERGVVLSPGDALSPDLLPREIVHPPPAAAERPRSGPPAKVNLREVIQAFCRAADNPWRARGELLAVVEEAALVAALDLGLNQRDLARHLGVNRLTLRKKLREYGIRT